MQEISRKEYAAMYGPTTGDRVRLADTSLIVEVEKDYCVYGDEAKFGGGKSLRDGMGQAVPFSDEEHILCVGCMHQEEVHAPLPCTFSYLIPVPHPPAGYVLHHPDQALPLSPDEEETPQYVGSDLPYSHCIPSHWKKAWYTPSI